MFGKALIPSDKLGRTLSLVIAIVTLTVWIVRAALNQYLYDLWIEGGGFNSAYFLMALCPVFVVAIAFGLLLIAIILRYALSKRGHPTPALLLAGFVITLFLPLPPLPPYPEELSFPNDRATYEQVVELARLRQLEHDNVCRSDIAFALPLEYRHLSAAECITIYYPPLSPSLLVAFQSGRSHRYIVYAETEAALTASYACYQDGAVHKKLDQEWYICVTDSL